MDHRLLIRRDLRLITFLGLIHLLVLSLPSYIYLDILLIIIIHSYMHAY